KKLRERGEGRAPVHPQGRPFQRRSLGRIIGRGGERREARGVALGIEDRGLGTERRGLRQDQARGRRGGRRGLDRGEGARRWRRFHAWEVRIGELGGEVRVARRRGGRRSDGGVFGLGGGAAEAARARGSRPGKVGAAELSRE